MFNRLFGKRQRSKPTTGLTVAQCKANLIGGQAADLSARTLGDLAIAHKDKEAVLALWQAILDTNHLASIIDPCAYTVGRIVWEGADATLEDVAFDIFRQSTGTKTDLIVDKFAYVLGDVFLKAGRAATRQRARAFIDQHAASPDPMVRRRYSYTKNRIARSR